MYNGQCNGAPEQTRRVNDVNEKYNTNYKYGIEKGPNAATHVFSDFKFLIFKMSEYCSL